MGMIAIVVKNHEWKVKFFLFLFFFFLAVLIYFRSSLLSSPSAYISSLYFIVQGENYIAIYHGWQRWCGCLWH
jgi:hypothetical protein